MPVEHQCLQRKQQRANTQPRRVYDAHCVYHMQKDAVPKTQSCGRTTENIGQIPYSSLFFRFLPKYRRGWSGPPRNIRGQRESQDGIIMFSRRRFGFSEAPVRLVLKRLHLPAQQVATGGGGVHA